MTLIQLQNDLVVAKPVDKKSRFWWAWASHLSLKTARCLLFGSGRCYIKTVIIVRGIAVCFQPTEPRTIQTQSLKQSHTKDVLRKLYPEVLWKASVTKVSLYLYIEVHVDPMVVHGSFGYVVKEARDAMLAVQRRNLVDRKPHLLLMTFLLMTSWLTYLLSRVWLNAGHDHKRELVHSSQQDRSAQLAG